MSNVFDRLCASPAAVNRMAAMQLGHDKKVLSQRDILHDEQRAVLEQARTDVIARLTEERGKASAAKAKLQALPRGSNYTKDFAVHTIRLQNGVKGLEHLLGQLDACIDEGVPLGANARKWMRRGYIGNGYVTKNSPTRKAEWLQQQEQT